MNYPLPPLPAAPRTAGGAAPAVAVVGAGFGGLSCAIHLRRAGCEVTVFEQNDLPGGRAGRLDLDGFRFDTGPSLLNYPWVFEDLFETAGRRFADYVELLPVDPSITFRWRDGPAFSLSSNLQRLLAECQRLDPAAAPGLTAFLADAEFKYDFAFRKLVLNNETDPVRWFARLAPREAARSAVWRSLESELRRFFRHRRLRDALGSYAMYLGGSPWQLPGLFSILPFGELAHGLYLPRGGMYGLVEGLVRLARELGVRFEFGRAVRRLRVRDDRMQGLECADGSFHEATLVVSNVDAPATLAALLPPEYARRQNNLLGRPMKMTCGVITFYWGVRGETAGLGHHTIFLPDDARRAYAQLFDEQRLPDDLPFYIAVPSATEPALAPPGGHTVFALAPVPTLDVPRDWPAAVADVRARILTRLEGHGIRLDPARFAVERVFTPEDWRDRYGLFQGSAFGAAHTLLQLGPLRDRNWDPRVRGLFYTGAGVPPGTGVPMTTLGGRMTAERVLHHVCGRTG